MKMKPTKAFSPPAPTPPQFFSKTKTLDSLVPYYKTVPHFHTFHHHHHVKFPLSLSTKLSLVACTSSQVIAPDLNDNVFHPTGHKLEKLEETIEKVIYMCRFLAILAVCGSLVGSFLCFVKGCTYIVASFQVYLVNRGKMIALLVEAIDIYLLGTVMLVFGMGLYELFISNLDQANLETDGKNLAPHRSNFFGLFILMERPRWLEIKTVNALKTKLGHVIVMLLLIGLFEKSKKAIIQTPVDLLCFAASIFLSSSCLYLLSQLSH